MSDADDPIVEPAQPDETPPPDVPPAQHGTLEAQRDTLQAQLVNYPPFHAERKRLLHAIHEIDSAIRERNRAS